MPRLMIMLRLWDAGGLYASTGVPSNRGRLNSCWKNRRAVTFEFLEFCEKILATCYFATVFESDEIRLAGCARHACDLVDKVTGRFYFGSVGVPFSVQEAKGTRDLVSGTVADKLRFF